MHMLLENKRDADGQPEVNIAIETGNDNRPIFGTTTNLIEILAA